MNNFSDFIRFQRKKLGITQGELATKAGVGLRFVRELEQGKPTLRLDKVEQVLQLFGFQVTPSRQQIDPYHIFWNYLNKGVKITLSNKVVKLGVIISEIIDKKVNKIGAWKFVSNGNIIEYQRKPAENLTEIIAHSEIASIEYQ